MCTGGVRAGAVLDVPAAGHRRRTRERPAALIPDAAAIVTPPARPGSDMKAIGNVKIF